MHLFVSLLVKLTGNEELGYIHSLCLSDFEVH